MQFKKIIFILVLLLISFSLITSVNAGFFDFLGFGNITNEFDYAYGQVTIEDNDTDNYLKLSDSDVGWKNMGFYKRDLYECTLDLSLKLDSSDIKWINIDGNNPPFDSDIDKRLSGNITRILNDSIYNNSDMNLTDMYIFYDVRDYQIELENDIYKENYQHYLYLNQSNIKIEGNKILIGASIDDASTEYDLRQLKGTNATVYLNLEGESSSISISVDVNIT